ncbi:MAG TPA: NADPH-dependent oxidoreductase [Nitrospirae bacterium]|nr:NADPH-dependent oxidoreductase [Nitrospirota bacterium]
MYIMMKSPRVLGINGSPRNNSTTDSLLNIALKGAIDSGATETEVLRLAEYSLPPCEGCVSYHGICNLQECTRRGGDVVRRILDTLKGADVLLFATPVYWFGPSGLMKNLIDRMTCLEHKQKILDGRVGGILCSYEEEGASLTISQLFLTLSDMGLMFPPYAYTYNRGETVSPDTEFYAYQLGKNAVLMSMAFMGKLWWNKTGR